MTAFIVINEEFTCEHCNAHNPKLPGSCRNHCRKCLYSKHLDDASPGDRASKCEGLMTPSGLSQNKKKGWMIHHQCQTCGKTIKNKAAPDDDFEKIVKLSGGN